MKPHGLLIDNLDSFTFNLVEAFERLGTEVQVLRNTVPAGDALARAREKGSLIVLSPGPGRPEDAGCMMELIPLAKGKVPVLGVAFMGEDNPDNMATIGQIGPVAVLTDGLQVREDRGPQIGGGGLIRRGGHGEGETCTAHGGSYASGAFTRNTSEMLNTRLSDKRRTCAMWPPAIRLVV